MYHRYRSIAHYSHPVQSPLSPSTVSNSAGAPIHVERQVEEDELFETTSASGTVGSNRDFEAITINDHAPAFTLAPALDPSAIGISSSWTTSRTGPESSPVVFALDISSTSGTLSSENASSQRLTAITAVPSSTVHESTGSTTNPSSSSAASESAPTQMATASPIDIHSARTTGIILGSVLGGLVVLLVAGLAIIYTVWRRRRKRQDQADREKEPNRRQPSDAEDGTVRGSGCREKRG